jgi:flagellar L-ring protein precursor FlgH
MKTQNKESIMKSLDVKGCAVATGAIVFMFVLFMLAARVQGMDNSMVWGSSLYEDPKASRVGDLVTVLIMEDSKAKQVTGTERGKTASVGVATDGVLADLPQLSGKGETYYKGDLATNRTTSVKATVTAMVTGIQPNGNLQIEGGKHTTVNGEQLEVTVTGLVRPVDIQPGNMVSSDYLANSNIVYKGVKEKGFWRVCSSVLTFPFRLLEPLF